MNFIRLQLDPVLIKVRLILVEPHHDKEQAMEAKNTNNNANGKEGAVQAVMDQIAKQHGKGAIMRLGDGTLVPEVPVVSTGSLGLDLALGIGGLPRGRIVEVYGPESSGKTTLALHLIAEAQRAGGIAAFIDAEHALDVGYAKKLGVKADDLLLSQPDSGEQALEIADMLVNSSAIDVVVIDSVAALVPKAELEGEMGDSHMGLQARLMSQALRKLTASCAKSKTMVLFINQLRMKIGVMFGSPETTTGGNALKFYASVRLDIRRIGSIKEGENVIGSRTRVKVVKNKMASPFKTVEFDICYGQGISRAGEILDMGVDANLIDKNGSWFSYKGERVGQGREAARRHLLENQEILREVRQVLLEKAGVVQPEQAKEVEPDAPKPAASRSSAKSTRSKANGAASVAAA